MEEWSVVSKPRHPPPHYKKESTPSVKDISLHFLLAEWVPLPEDIPSEVKEWSRDQGWCSKDDVALHPLLLKCEARIFYSQQGEDLEVYIDYFKDRQVEDGIYIEAGAGEGFAHSNTLYFEKNENFKGLLVEPNPHAFKALVEIRAERNHLFNCALGETGGECMLKVDRKEGHCSFVEGNLLPELEETHHKAATQTVQVPRRTLAQLVGLSGEPWVDVFFLDVEGSELAVLKGWDWSIPIYVMVIEMFDSATDPQTLRQYEEIREILRDRGYVFNKRHSSNEIWHLPVFRDGKPTLTKEWENE